jgi:hypothetical protein
MVPALPLPGTHARRNPHINRFRAPHAPLTTTRFASGPQLAGSAAARARHVKPHLARSLLGGSRAAASRARLGRTHRAGTVAVLARIKPRDGKFFHRAANGVPEINLNLVFEVVSGLLFRLHLSTASASEKLAEQITEVSPAAGATRPAAKIESAKIKVDVGMTAFGSCPAGSAWWKVIAVEAMLVVHLPLFRIGENVVRFLKLLELFFRGFVARIQVWMVFPGEFPESRTNILHARLPRDSQEFVIVLFRSCRHRWPGEIIAGAHAAACAPAAHALIRTFALIDVHVLGVDHVAGLATLPCARAAS